MCGVSVRVKRVELCVFSALWWLCSKEFDRSLTDSEQFPVLTEVFDQTAWTSFTIV